MWLMTFRPTGKPLRLATGWVSEQFITWYSRAPRYVYEDMVDYSEAKIYSRVHNNEHFHLVIF